MKILAVYRHYWPDTTPYARLLRAILEEQASQGHEVSVFTAQPSYNDIQTEKQPGCEQLGGVSINRIGLLPERKHLRLLRGFNYLYFLVRSILHVLWFRRYDLIVANTHPPVLMGVALRIIKRLTGMNYVMHCQDIHPESAVLGGQLQTGWLEGLLKKLDHESLRRATRVVTLSEDMKQTLQQRSDEQLDNITVLNNFPLDVYEAPDALPSLFAKRRSDVFQVLFAGNMGRFQDLGRLLRAAHSLRDELDIQFVFMGAGAEFNSLRDNASELIAKTVFFEPHQPVEVAFGCMRKADLGVVSLKDGVSSFAYPSKTMTYLAAGCPVMALAEPHSQVAREISTQNFGYVPQNTSSEEIAATILRAKQERTSWSESSRMALIERSSRFFGRNQAMERWNKLFEELSTELRVASILPAEINRTCQSLRPAA